MKCSNLSCGMLPRGPVILAKVFLMAHLLFVYWHVLKLSDFCLCGIDVVPRLLSLYEGLTVLLRSRRALSNLGGNIVGFPKFSLPVQNEGEQDVLSVLDFLSCHFYSFCLY